jgi:hypothetical protein
MGSIYGERFNIMNTHHVETKAKLDSILAKNTQIEVNNDAVESKLDTGNASHASIDGKITTCDTGAVVVASSALPAGAASESSLAAMNGKVVACNTGAVVVASSALPAGAASESSLAAMNGKITACNTGACVVSSSALPTGAADSTKQDEIKTLIAATNTALAGTLTVSSPAISKTASTPVNNQSVNGQSDFTSAEIDVSANRHFALIGSSSDTMNSHEVDVLVSNASGGTFFKTSHSGYYLSGDFHLHLSDHPYKYLKVKVKNGDSAVGNTATFTIHLLESN